MHGNKKIKKDKKNIKGKGKIKNILQVNAPPPGSWEHAVDERDLTVEQWKELIYKVFENFLELFLAPQVL